MIRKYLPTILPILIALALGSAALTACQTAAPGDQAAVIEPLATPGKALATAMLSPTPPVTATPPDALPNPMTPTLPLPTAMVLVQPTMSVGIAPTPTQPGAPGPLPTSAAAAAAPGGCPAPAAPFEVIWNSYPAAREQLGCPVGGVYNEGGAMQSFQNGVMFWRQRDASIFVIAEGAIRQGAATDTWWRLADTWQEGEPPDDPGLVPPAGLLQPVRGFGKAWRSHGFVRDALGWATAPEFALVSQWQDFQNGWMMTGPNGSPVYVMIPADAPPHSTGSHLGPLR